jgi:hypothetical protein
MPPLLLTPYNIQPHIAQRQVNYSLPYTSLIVAIYLYSKAYRGIILLVYPKFYKLPYSLLPIPKRGLIPNIGSVPTRAQYWEIEAKYGLPSADRNNKATLLLTGPFCTAKSSAKDLTPLVLKLQYAKYYNTLQVLQKNRLLRR